MWMPSSRTLSLSHVTIVQSSIPVIARASRQAFAVRAVELACDVEFSSWPEALTAQATAAVQSRPTAHEMTRGA